MQNVNADIPNSMTFPNGTVALTSINEWIDDQWRRWIGELRAEDLQECNLVILRHLPSTRPEVLDAEHENVSREAHGVLILTAYQGIPMYESAWSIRGSLVGSRRDVRQMGRLPDLYTTQGTSPVRISETVLRQADAMLPDWLAISDSHEFQRFRLSRAMLLNGFRESYGEERIHQYARALEGLVLPDIGSTERQFVHRCLTFTEPDDESRMTVRDIFRMRSATEHLHTWDTRMQQYTPAARKAIALRRIRQAEKLASAAILRILTVPDVRTWFSSDARITEFWRLRDDERSAIWGEPFRLSEVS
jgi:hypothetical protein